MSKPLLLLVDDDISTAAVLAGRLAEIAEVRVANSGVQALRSARECMPDLAIMDAEMPGMTGFELCQAFKQDTRLQQVPVIIASAFHDAPTEAAARALGAVDFVRKPYAGAALVERVRACLDSTAHLPGTAVAARRGARTAAGAAPGILIVDDDTAAIQVIYTALKHLDARFIFATDGEQALRLAAERRPDLVLLDIQMPGMDGIETCRRLQEQPELAHIPVIFVTRYADPEHEARALAAGGTDFISKPYSPAVLQARIGTVLRLKRQSDAKLRAEREHWRQLGEERVAEILERASDAVLSVDGRGEIVLFNAAASALFGLPAAQALGCRLDALLPAAWPTPALDASSTLQVDIARPDGTRLYAQMSCTQSGSDETRITTVWLRDLSAQMRLEEAMRARLKAEAENQAKSAFLASMSHEIRTPLNAIIGLTHLMRRRELDAEQRLHADQIDSAGRHLLSTINDILDLARIEANCLELVPEHFPAAQLFDEVCAMLRAGADAKHIELVAEHAGLPEFLHGDRARLAQALLNLASNAVKFTDQGKVELRARVLAQEDENLLVRFEVCDTGAGIVPAEMARLFQAFSQVGTDNTRHLGGSGLGLAITRRLAQLMGGSAGADSVPGQGSRFWFDVRLQRGLELTPEPPAGALCPAEPELAARSVRMLLVEDEPVNR
ncbi:MAG: response regulator, partial [Rhodocyclaceae bacterium]|nr:response regulator [Rhodocyclaceae bacterium]